MNLTRNQIIIIGIVFLIIVFFVLAFIFFRQENRSQGGIGGNQQTEINFWGIEDEKAVNEAINSYSQINPNVKIIYTRLNEVNYEKSLLNALAGGRGPDIIMFHRSWLKKHYDKIAPVNENQLPLISFGQLFPQAAEDDFIANNKIYALPLYFDTLALIYNKDFFDSKGVAIMPTTWREFQYSIPKIRELDLGKKIVKAAVAIGGSEKNINGAVDLLSLIMLQFKTEMIDEKTNNANFARTGGLDALNFYLQFSNSASPYYTWNDNLENSIDNFSQGTAAAIFNYASVIPIIKEKSPALNLGVSPMLQFDSQQPVNYADYWGLTVSNQSQNPSLAWDFVLYLTANPQANDQYLQTAQRPPALRSLIQKYLNDPDWGIFANQALTARSWPQLDNLIVKQIFSNMIESVLNGRLDSSKAIQQAENEVNGL